MEIIYRTLEEADDRMLFEAFQKGFEDYLVPLSFTFDKFQKNNVRRGLAKDISMGAFLDDHLIGFVFNGKRLWKDELTAYDLGTAVFKEYRGKGISTAMLERLNEILISKGIKKYLLEVIRDNEGAYKLYLKQGFEITRKFECMNASRNELSVNGTYSVETTEAIDWNKAKRTWEQMPSWQCSADSVNAVVGDLKIVTAKKGDEFVGYGIADPQTGEIIQIGVQEEYRRQGFAASILKELFSSSERDELKFLNIEAENRNLIGFLRHAGFQDGVSQYEMMKSLG